MNSPVVLAVFGWFLPGGSYLLMRRYLQFAGFAALVTVTFVAGLALGGSFRWPQAAELAGLDGFTGLFFQAGALARLLAGAPYLLAHAAGGSVGFLQGRVHEYGTVLLTLAGVFNVLAIASALELRKEVR